jgi:hypothetical protein
MQQLLSSKQPGSKSYTTSRNVSAVMFSRSTPTTTFGIPAFAATEGSASCDTGDDCEVVGDGDNVSLGECCSTMCNLHLGSLVLLRQA